MAELVGDGHDSRGDEKESHSSVHLILDPCALLAEWSGKDFTSYQGGTDSALNVTESVLANIFERIETLTLTDISPTVTLLVVYKLVICVGQMTLRAMYEICPTHPMTMDTT